MSAGTVALAEAAEQCQVRRQRSLRARALSRWRAPRPQCCSDSDSELLSAWKTGCALALAMAAMATVLALSGFEGQVKVGGRKNSSTDCSSERSPPALLYTGMKIWGKKWEMLMPIKIERPEISE